MKLSHSDLLELKRWNTPSIYNGWERITSHDSGSEGFNMEPVTDLMPHMGPMIGYAVTVKIEPSNPVHKETNPDGWIQYRQYVASFPGPKIVVVQDLDKPIMYGAFWGEVNSNIHRALGCVGTITDGAVRDFDEMNNVGFKALARGFCVGHSYSHPVQWNCDVEVFGRKIRPGDLIHADKHGFLVIPESDQLKLLDAVRFMDSNECKTMIRSARSSSGKDYFSFLADLNQAIIAFQSEVKKKFGGNLL